MLVRCETKIENTVMLLRFSLKNNSFMNRTKSVLYVMKSNVCYWFNIIRIFKDVTLINVFHLTFNCTCRSKVKFKVTNLKSTYDFLYMFYSKQLRSRSSMFFYLLFLIQMNNHVKFEWNPCNISSQSMPKSLKKVKVWPLTPWKVGQGQPSSFPHYVLSKSILVQSFKGIREIASQKTPEHA